MEEISTEISGEGDQVIDDEIEEVEDIYSTEGHHTCTSRNDLYDAIEVLSKLSLFWNDEERDDFLK